MFRGAKKAATKTTVEQLPEGEEAAGLLPEGAAGAEPLVLRKQITGALEQDPERVKKLFASWIEEKGA